MIISIIITTTTTPGLESGNYLGKVVADDAETGVLCEPLYHYGDVVVVVMWCDGDVVVWWCDGGDLVVVLW